MNENITMAAQTANLLCLELKDALNSADPILGLLLMALLEEAAKLRRELELLKNAMEEDDE